MAQTSYLIDDPGGYDALLTTCHTCMPNKASTCPDCTVTSSVTLTGEDPDSGSYGWGSDDIGGQAGSRSAATDRWPYQIKSTLVSIGCTADCAYLIRIQYKLQTSSARRSFFQTGVSDIWLVERWDTDGDIQEMFCVATSPIFDINNAQFASDYSGDPANKQSGFSGDKAIYFNPYGLRENYDDMKTSVESHCGTLMFFAKGNDVIKFRLAQHTHINDTYDLNPDGRGNRTGGITIHDDVAVGPYDVAGTFTLKAFTRPIPGALKLSRKSANDLSSVKYHPKLFA